METKTDNTAEKADTANFWIRLVAHLIDRSLFIINVALALFLMYDNIGIGLSFIVLPFWLYYALMEGSRNGATVGKLIMRIKVTNMESEKINFSIATLRLFMKLILSDLLLIGYLFIFFTEKRQALHDIIAGTLVVKKSKSGHSV